MVDLEKHRADAHQDQRYYQSEIKIIVETLNPITSWAFGGAKALRLELASRETIEMNHAFLNVTGVFHHNQCARKLRNR